MAYSFQTFSVEEILTSSKMNQVEVNIRDHVHGGSSVGNVGTTAAADTNNTTLATTAYVIGQAATQAQQETGTSVLNFVTSGCQHFHPSALKIWGSCGIAGNLNSPSYNVTSVGDTGAGQATVTIATDFSSAVYALWCNPIHNTTRVGSTASMAAGSFILECRAAGTGSLTDPTTGYHFGGAGDHA